MKSAGFVLVGGKSSRMGRDKALLPFRGKTLAQHIAAQLESVTGSVTLVGDPGRYGQLGYRVIPDRRAGQGPLAGIETALSETTSDWNVIVACDLPSISATLVAELLEAAEGAGCDCLMPVSAGGMPEPLCAVYHRRALQPIRAALNRNIRKVTQALENTKLILWPIPDPALFRNVNTPADWNVCDAT